MKNFLVLYIALIFMITACSNTVQEKDLANRSFVLVKADSIEAAGQLVTLEFDENLRISAQVCNRFSGASSLKDGVLTMPLAMSTFRLCGEGSLDAIERMFEATLVKGAKVSLTKNGLTLTGEAHTLVFTPTKK